MKTNRCINCEYASYCGKDAKENLLFGCKRPFCVFTPITPNEYHSEVIKELQKNK